MARWKLTAPHYLGVPGTEWEQKETNQQTGKQARKVYKVPMYLDPKDTADCNYPGEIIVAHGYKKHERQDILFENANGSPGDPSPDMEPLDEEAEAISAKFRKRWTNPIEDLPATGMSYADSRIQEFEGQIAALMAKVPTRQDPVVANLQAEVARLTKLVEGLTKAK